MNRLTAAAAAGALVLGLLVGAAGGFVVANAGAVGGGDGQFRQMDGSMMGGSMMGGSMMGGDLESMLEWHDAYHGAAEQ